MNAVERLIFILTICVVCLIVSKNIRAGDEWKQAYSKNFYIVGNTPDKDCEKLVRELESFRQNFFNLFQLNEAKSPVPWRVLVFKSELDFESHLKTRKISGKKEIPEDYLQEGQDANYIVATLKETGKFDLKEIYHQYFHYLVKNNIGKSKIPVWLNEGLAQLHEGFQNNGEIKQNLENSERKQLELLKQSKLLPSDIFFNIDYYTLNQQANHGKGVFGAQSSVIVYYLLQTDKNEQFKDFIGLLKTGVSANESLIRTYRTNLFSAEKDLKTFIEQKSPETDQKIQVITPSAIDLKFSPISEAEREALLGDFLYQANYLDEAELHLLQSLSLKPFAAFPKSTLGLVKLRRYSYEDALQHLTKSLEFKDANYLNYYRLAFALSRQGMTEYGFVSSYDAETAGKIRELLKRSIEQNPDFAESYNLYALVNFVRHEEIDESLDFTAKALEIAPGNDWYQLRKSELEMRKENFIEARKLAQKIYLTAADEGLRLYAQNTIQRIDSTEYQLLQSRREAKYPYSSAISDIPFSDEEIARLRAKAMRDSLNLVLRRPTPDQKRIQGNIIAINCLKNQVDFTVKSDNQLIRLRADSFESLNLMTFSAGLSRSEIGCGMLNKEHNAIIIYRKSSNSGSDMLGEILSIEFVPGDFALSENK